MASDCPATDSLIENGKNKEKLYCERCSSLIMLPQVAKLETIDVPFDLPHMKKKTEEGSGDTEPLKEFWVINDMFKFENVGFSNTVENIKYLICADCEIGPIGWHKTDNKTAFYVSVKRVKYQE